MLSNEARPGPIAATSQSDMQTLAPEVAPFWMLHPEQCACARIMGSCSSWLLRGSCIITSIIMYTSVWET